MESFFGKKFPNCIKAILTKSGYDNIYAVEAINEENILKIEQFLSENKHLLKNTVYDKNSDKSAPFKFLPGHRAIILELPNKIEEFNKKADKTPSDTPPSQISDVSPEHVDQLKELLIGKFINYSKNIEFEQKLDKENLTEFKQIGAKFQCRVKCPICPKDFLCNYKTYWAISNIQAHIKKHRFANLEQNSLENSDPKSISSTLTPTSSEATKENTRENNTTNNSTAVHRISSEQNLHLSKILHK